MSSTVAYLCSIFIRKSCRYAGMLLLSLIASCYGCSNDTCTDQVDAECRDIIPYTSYPNKLFGLESAEDYNNFTMKMKDALSNCTVDPEMARWGACNIILPRCLLGYDLQLCRNTCLGKAWLFLFPSKFYI